MNFNAALILITGTLFMNCMYVICHDEDVYTIQYTAENFAEELPKKHHFVMFYAPWCGHCQRLAPTWEQLAEMLNEDDNNIKIAKVDCTTDKKVCSDHDVTGYPTLKFFKKGKTEGEKFRGTRDLPTLTTFINEELREEDEEDELNPGPMYGLKELTDETFDNEVATGKHFIKFYAPWCGHCQQLAPVWQELAKALESDSSVSIAKIDCTKNKLVCTNYEIKGYPTLLWIEDAKKVDKYQGLRTHEDLAEYVTKMSGDGEVGSQDNHVPSEIKGAVDELNAEDFKIIIKEGVTVVKYFAPWCGHCKRLAPTWDDLGRKYRDHKLVNVVKVDCTLAKNKELCNTEKVEGFPTIYLYKNGVKVSEYTGSRSLEDLQEFISHHLPHDEL